MPGGSAARNARCLTRIKARNSPLVQHRAMVPRLEVHRHEGAMIEFYAEIKWVHVAAVIASGSLFLLRGMAVQARAGWPMAAPVRYLSYAIDIVLLAAAVMMLTVLPSALFANGWLAAKLSLLVVYIGLGTFALKRGRTPAVRRATFAGALLVYAAMFSVARAHHPLGPLYALVS